MGENLAAGYLEGDDLAAALDCDRHLGAGRALHAAHHAVLRETYARNRRGVDLEQTVSRLHAELLGGAAGDDLDHHRRIVGHVELYSDTGEVAGKVFLRLFELLRRHVY